MTHFIFFTPLGHFPTSTNRDWDTNGGAGVDIFGDDYYYSLRDGTPDDDDDDVTDTIPDEIENGAPTTDANRRYAYHESHSFYELCQYTERNVGLYSSDQRVRRNDQRG